jgi:hypothetical protein
VARAHLSAKAAPDALAEDYPPEAFVTADDKPLRVDDARNADRLALRVRRLAGVAIPADALRKGANVVAIEVHRAAVPELIGAGRIGQENSMCGWPPIGLLDARVTVTAAAPPAPRPAGIQVWNCAPYDTITAFDYGDGAPLRPITVFAARNGVFSGRLAVRSDLPIEGLKAVVTDLSRAGGGRIPAAGVRVRCAEPAVAGKSWMPPYRFDGLSDAMPATIPVARAGLGNENFFSWPVDRRGVTAGAVAPLWFTVRVPRDAAAGVYEGKVTVTAAELAPLTVPLRVTVSDWTVPDPREFRVQNFAYHSDDAVALHYGVPRWSDRHFELMGQSLALMGEVNSRQVFLNVAVNFFGGNKGGGDGSNEEGVIRWVKKPDGSLAPDFTVFDKFLDMVARYVGKPLPLRLNCWVEWGRQGEGFGWTTPAAVTLFDPATGRTERLAQPPADSPEFTAFWKPALDEARKRITARGWWEATAIGHNSYCYSPSPVVVDRYHEIWPDGVWAYTAHNGSLGGRFGGTSKDIGMPVRYADTVWGGGQPTARGCRELLKPRPGYWCFTYRGCFRDASTLTDLRRVGEDEVSSGHDGVSDFGADLFPLKASGNRVYAIPNGRGTGGPGNSTMAVLAPGPDGPIATERFEMLREGMELAEALLFVERALQDGRLPAELQARAGAYLDERGEAFRLSWFGMRHIQAAHDEKLLALAGEVARARTDSVSEGGKP